MTGLLKKSNGWMVIGQKFKLEIAKNLWNKELNLLMA